jgi:hypothetical protein
MEFLIRIGEAENEMVEGAVFLLVFSATLNGTVKSKKKW